MSGRYNAGRDALATGALSWIGSTILAQLVSSRYVFNEDHATQDDLAWTVGDAVEVTGKTAQDGWLMADRMRFPQVFGNEPAAAIVFYSEEPGTLLEYHDAIEDFPMMPNGGDIEIEVLPPGIFRI